MRTLTSIAILLSLASCIPSTGSNKTTYSAGLVASILSLSIDNEGVITITISSESFTTLSTPIGSFGPFIAASYEYVNPALEFPTQQTLSIVTTQYQWVYDLNGEQFEVELDNVDATVKGDGQGNIIVKVYDGEVNASRQPIVNRQVTESCPGAFPTQLRIGDYAKVATFQVKVYQGPGPDYALAQYKYLRGDRVVTILEGPVCNGGMLWWYVDSGIITLSNGEQDNVIGWIPEESGDEWILEPAN